MKPIRKGVAGVGGLFVAAGSIAWLQFETSTGAGILWLLGALVAPMTAAGVDEGLKNAAFAILVSLPLVVVGFTVVVAVSADGPLGANLGASFLGVLFILPIIKLALAVPLLTVGAVLGYVQGVTGVW
ncbi:hypothetical protein BRC64_10545 [Halobacteriales archaeon QH_10_67_22]|nr:MAG: hypothetical protein BRC64_10545 [Halobacteriales archaeon QH_10_67_22]